MRILLTGSTGFIGTALGRRLLIEGHEIFSVCRPETQVPFGTRVVWDGGNPFGTRDFPHTADAVVHLAQSRSYRRFPADSGEMFAVNVAMTMSLLEWATRSGVKQFCLVSSGAVYEPFGRDLTGRRSSCSARFSGRQQVRVGNHSPALLEVSLP